MDKTQFLKLIDELLELDEGALKGDEQIDGIGWDSLATISFMALVDERFGLSLQPRQIAGCSTVSDLSALLGDRITVGSLT